MGTEQSTLTKNDYITETETENVVVATKGDEKFYIKKICLNQISRDARSALNSEIEILKTINHPHIVSCTNSFEDQNTYNVVMDYCQGRSLAAKIRKMSHPPEEFEILSWIVEICMALRTIHEKGLLHKHLTPENILLTEFGLVCLGETGKVHEISKKTKNQSETPLHYLAPEVFTDGTYDAKSDIWSVGCILYELCGQQPAFSAETPIRLMPKIIGGPYPSLSGEFSPELRELLNDIFNSNPQSRPTASEIIGSPFIIGCLIEKCKSTVMELQTKLDKLRDVADSLERVHKNTTIGSLAGGVIGAAGGITSIVGLILAPFTLGASLIVTGVGVGVGVAGGLTAGGSNITNMVNQSSDRKIVRSIIKEFEEKIDAVVTWLQQIKDSLQTIRSRYDSAGTPDTEVSQFSQDNLIRLGIRAGRGLGGIAELVRLVQVMNMSRIAAQASRAVRVAEVATGVLSGLFVAVDIFFIAMDAKEIHHIRQAQAAEDRGATTARSEIMKFVVSIRQAADNLQKVLDELKSIITSIPSLRDERVGEWRDMELV